MPPYVKNFGRWPFATVPKATFSFAMAVMDKVGGRNVGGVVHRCAHVDLHQSRTV